MYNEEMRLQVTAQIFLLHFDLKIFKVCFFKFSIDEQKFFFHSYDNIENVYLL